MVATMAEWKDVPPGRRVKVCALVTILHGQVVSTHCADDEQRAEFDAMAEALDAALRMLRAAPSGGGKDGG